MSPFDMMITIILGVLSTLIAPWLMARWAKRDKEIWGSVWNRAGVPIRGIVVFLVGAGIVGLLLETDPAALRQPAFAFFLVLLMFTALLMTFVGALVLFILVGRRLVVFLKAAWWW